MTQLRACGKFEKAGNDNAYKVAGGLDGCGVSVVNALSDFLDLTSWRHDEEYFMRFQRGDAVAPLKVVGPAEGKKGTRVTFLPSHETFKITEFDFDKLEHRYRELAFLNSGVRIVLADERSEERKEVELHYEGGIAAFVKWLDRTRSEEHTSELQSLMRISYAVFCLKKKNSKKMTEYKHVNTHNKH